MHVGFALHCYLVKKRCIHAVLVFHHVLIIAVSEHAYVFLFLKAGSAARSVALSLALSRSIEVWATVKCPYPPELILKSSPSSGESVALGT